MIKTYADALLEFKRLQRISERQSAMLAQALKEKNDAVGLINAREATRISYLEKQVENLRDRNDELDRKVRDIQNSAKVFFRAVGV